MPTSRPRSRARRRSGFALPAVLAVTGVVTLIFLVAITALASLSAEAASARARVRFLQRAMSAEAALSFMAATEPTRAYGFGVNDIRQTLEMEGPQQEPSNVSGVPVEKVMADGRRYTMDVDGPLVLRLQDQAGLINTAQLFGQPHERFLESAGVQPGERQALIARYTDYIDSDDLRQPNGAERADYADGGPANRRLIRPTEWLSILGARQAVEPKKWRALRDALAADATSATQNVNTAGPAALAVWFGLNDSQIETLMRVRAERPLTSLYDVASVTGAVLDLDQEQIFTYPSGATILTLHDTRSAWVYRARLTLTPFGLEQPLWIDQTELTEAPKRARADTTDAIRLPYAPR
ncbi:type II secretion system protein GspK [Brevundimonas naejangsanensis]|uniref:type II secretion system protein GspK n=1 Tax=Brevundimonas naejangsanensis TaxID=588932 RepID=UPI0011AAD1B8|nr:type II secretion system protein GspK [Brevundimonas naejangsanensis]